MKPFVTFADSLCVCTEEMWGGNTVSRFRFKPEYIQCRCQKKRRRVQTAKWNKKRQFKYLVMLTLLIQTGLWNILYRFFSIFLLSLRPQVYYINGTHLLLCLLVINKYQAAIKIACIDAMVTLQHLYMPFKSRRKAADSDFLNCPGYCDVIKIRWTIQHITK